LVLNALPTTPHTSASAAAAALSLMDCFALAYLSYLEHIRSFRPSTLINFYLLLSALFDGVQVRTLWLLPGPHRLAAVFTAAFALKILLLLLEATEKRSLLRPVYRSVAIESTSGIINRSLFWWLNSMLWQGYRSLLLPEGLITIDLALASKTVHASLEYHWAKSEWTIG